MNWNQLKTILWLRWRLTRNQWRRSGGLGAVLAAIVAVGTVVVGGLSFIGALLGAAYGLGDAKPQVLMGIWFGLTVGFLFFWLIGLLTELQRSETIDLQRLMHLPVALGQMFVINYVASHLAMSLILILPAMTGLAIGLAIARGPAMLLLLPLAWGMIFMITAWTYCLRGWLAAMMVNPRRRRSIIMGITIGFVLAGQLPNLFVNVFGRNTPAPPKSALTVEQAQSQRAARQAADRERLDKLISLQKFAPPLWLPVGAQALAEHRVWPALLGTVGCCAIGTLGLRRAYRSTVKFYQGDTGATPSVETSRAPGIAATAAKPGDNFLELRLPLVPEQAAAVALASFRSMLRAPEVKMAWAMSFIVTVAIGSSVLFRAAPKIPVVARPFVVAFALVGLLFMNAQLLGNQFGFDRQGFRALMLSPVDRRLILLGKNLANLPVGALFGLLLVTFTSVWLQLPALTALAAVFQLTTLLLLGCLGGNLLSILVPYRVESGTMKPTKMPALTVLVMVLCQFLLPVVMLPVFVPLLLELLWQFTDLPRGVPVNLLLSMALTAVTAFGYWKALTPLGQLLHRRETKILQTVTAEID